MFLIWIVQKNPEIMLRWFIDRKRIVRVYLLKEEIKGITVMSKRMGIAMKYQGQNIASINAWILKYLHVHAAVVQFMFKTII